MRRLVKRLLKKHKYPPEGMEDAVQTVMSQCEMWTDNVYEERLGVPKMQSRFCEGKCKDVRLLRG